MLIGYMRVSTGEQRPARSLRLPLTRSSNRWRSSTPTERERIPLQIKSLAITVGGNAHTRVHFRKPCLVIADRWFETPRQPRGFSIASTRPRRSAHIRLVSSPWPSSASNRRGCDEGRREGERERDPAGHDRRRAGAVAAARGTATAASRDISRGNRRSSGARLASWP